MSAPTHGAIEAAELDRTAWKRLGARPVEVGADRLDPRLRHPGRVGVLDLVRRGRHLVGPVDPEAERHRPRGRRGAASTVPRRRTEALLGEDGSHGREEPAAYEGLRPRRQDSPPCSRPDPPTRLPIGRLRWPRTTSSRPICAGARARGRRLGGRPAARDGGPGRLAGGARARRARRATGVLRTHDRYGRRFDDVDSIRPGTGTAGDRARAAAHVEDEQPGAHVVRAGLFMVWSRVNAGVMCPVSAAYSAIPALRERPSWRPSGSRDSRSLLRRRRARWDGDDREAGRLGRARQHHPRRARRRGRLRDHRPQVVLLPTRPATSSSPSPRPPPALLLPDRARPRVPHPAPEGQARHPLAALERGRVRGAFAGAWSARAAACRPSSGWSTTRLDCLLGSAASMRWGLAQAAPRCTAARSTSRSSISR